MSRLNDQQKQLLFDYCIGLTSEQQSTEAQSLITSSEEAAEIYSKLKAALAPLAADSPAPCPDELAEGTIWRLNNLAHNSQLQLQQLLAAEQAHTVTTKPRFWRNLGGIVTAAAVIVFAAVTLFPTLTHIREYSWHKQQCQMQLNRIFQGLNNYCSDHDGELPAVATTADAPWWKIGYQGKENYSNTRHIWLLVKGGYIQNPADFICPGTMPGQAEIIELTPAEVKSYNDFPARSYVTYSFRIKSRHPARRHRAGRTILIADLNPLFEQLPPSYSEPLNLELNKNLLTINSINHDRRGQNVLFGDGSIEFIKSRHIGLGGDDIFTLQNTDVYEGIEVPSSETDAFLAP